MEQKKKNGAIIAIAAMVFLFAMISFVTNMAAPFGTIWKLKYEWAGMVGNLMNFAAYLFMGIPAGMMITKIGYKKTALVALALGFIGVAVQYGSSTMNADAIGAYVVYLLGAFICGFCVCILNTVVNPMLNLMGGGGNKGNQLIQLGGTFNSAAAVAVYILMGALIGEVVKGKTAISDATPALMIAIAIFVVAFIVILFTKIEEPEQAPVDTSLIKGAMGYRHFALGTLAIFLYMGVEVGTPTYLMSYLTEAGISASQAGLVAAMYWLMMGVGRLTGASIGGKISSRTMLATVSTATLVLVLIGMFAPATTTVNVPGIDWNSMSVIWTEVPAGCFALVLVGLCTSVMWGSIFNLAVEGLGKYTAIASGIFMTMVFGCAVMMGIQGYVADLTNYMTSFWVVVFCAAYILFYALVGSKPAKK